MNGTAVDRVKALSCWRDAVQPEPLSGGITNKNFSVAHGGERFFVRLGDDIPIHGIMRFNERAASRAAHAAGISPEVVHVEPGALVLRFVEGRTLTAEDVREPATLTRIVDLVKRAHVEIAAHLRGPTLAFWPFHVVRDYVHTLRDGKCRLRAELDRFLEVSAALESFHVQTSMVFGHNDLLAANFIDDGERLWLIDWDYTGWGSPLFDLAGLASNHELDQEQERFLLRSYFECEPDSELLYKHASMKCASLLREMLWSLVSEIHSDLDFDYVQYTNENQERFERAWAEFQSRTRS